MRLFITLLGLVLCSGAAAVESPPPGGEPRDFELVEPTLLELDNGLRATLVEFGQVPKVTILIAVRTGNLNEGDKTWLADLTGELMTEGTGNLSARELADRAASMGGEISVSTGLEQTTVSLDVLEEYAEDAVALLAEVLRDPLLPESELDRLRGDLERRRSIAVTQPQQIAGEAFRGLLYAGHPFGKTLPDEGQLAAYTIDDVRGYYEGNFGAGRTRVYVGGRFDEEAVAEAIQSAFADWESGPEIYTNIPEPADQQQFLLLDRPGAPQSTLRMGLPVVDPTHPDWTDLAVANTLLGGFFSSRITSNIREDKGYTYSPRSSIARHYRDAHWLQAADVTSEHTGDSVREILGEIDRLREEAPEEAEMDRVRNFIIGNFVLGNATRFGILGQLAYVDFHGLDRDYLTGYVQRIEGATAEGVRAATAEYLDPARLTIVVVGDAESVTPQLQALPLLEDLVDPGS